MNHCSFPVILSIFFSFSLSHHSFSPLFCRGARCFYDIFPSSDLRPLSPPTFRDRNVFLRLFKQYVRPHLEFASPAWSPWPEADKEVLEKVQRRAVDMTSWLKAKTFEEKLRELGLTILEERRH
jgi:hypothetical protein